MTKFWIEDISYLFNSFYLIPTSNMGLEDQMNCMTRIVLIIFILMLITNISYDVLFLAISLLLIISIYYILKSFSKKENYIEYYGKVNTVLEPVPKVNNIPNQNDFIFSPPLGNPRTPCKTYLPETIPPLGIDLNNLDNPQLIDTQTSSAWCYRDIPIENTIGASQTLVGPPNPRTLVRPIIPNPIYDFETWQPNDFIVPNGINDQKRQEFYQNGYVISSENIPTINENFINQRKINNEFQQYRQSLHPATKYQNPNHNLNEIRENYPNSNEYNNYSNNQNYYNQNGYNNHSYPSIDKTCGYFPENLKYNLPINYNASACQKTNEMNEYNKNLFSIPIQPGIYTQSQVNQPYASMYNLGISMDQPFLPTTFNKEGNIYKYTENDPSQVEQIKNPPYNSQNFGMPLRNEIYDPRFTGYGTSYRSYIEPVTGQPRFYYDDINQITQPNYITRNNLDIYGFAPQVGTPNNPVLEGESLRQFANNNYTDNQLQYRTELQQRLMHKNSNREWQQRIAPIMTNNRSTVGGGTMSGFFK